MNLFIRSDNQVCLKNCKKSIIRIGVLMFAGAVIFLSNRAQGEPSSGTKESGNSLGAQSSSASVKILRDARGRKVQYVDFSEAVIEGKARLPEGFVIQSRASGRFNSLIELRKSFRENIEVQALEAATLPPLSK